jgi:apolipoprotein N-acyltransferase
LKPILKELLALFLAVLSGVLVALAFPPWNLEWIIWVAFVPVLFALLFLRRNWLTALAQGAVFGGVFGGITFFWRLTAGAPSDWAWNVFGLAAVGSAWGTFINRFVHLPEKPQNKNGKLSPILPGYGFRPEAWNASVAHLRAAMLAAAAWTFLEWARGVLFSGWNLVGTVVQNNLPLLQLVTLTGGSGLSFVVVFANLIVLTTVRRIFIEPGRMNWASRFDALVTLAGIFAIALFGFVTLQKQPESGRKRIVLVSSDELDPDRLIQISKGATIDPVDLFVWHSARIAGSDYGKLAALGGGLVAGVPGAKADRLGGAVVIIPGSVKNVLVMPVNENVFQPRFRLSGRSLSPFLYKDTNWMPLLNWEGSDPLLIRAALTKGVQVPMVLAHPAKSGGFQQMLANFRLWTVAFGRPLIFSAGKNASAILTRSGAMAGHDSAGPDVLVGQIDPPNPFDATVYGQYGDWFAIACGTIAMVLAISGRLQRTS